MKRGTCKLCLMAKPLVPKSHIISEFLYELSGLYDEKHRLNSVSFEQGAIKNVRLKQKGEWESNILCRKCEGRIGKYEDYARRALFGGVEIECWNERLPSLGVIARACRLEYSSFKLFQLSLLWRASISKRPLFRDIVFEPEKQESLRQMLRMGHSGTKSDYPCIMMHYYNMELPTDFIAQPSVHRVEGFEAVSFMIGGMLYMFFLSSIDTIPEYFHDLLLKEDGVLRIAPLPREGAVIALLHAIGKPQATRRNPS